MHLIASRPASMPKPNTRFLQRIIKSTNSHNANLLATEAAESQARLKQLERLEERQRRRTGVPSDIRRRQMGDIKAILGGRNSSTRPLESKTAEKPDRNTYDSKRRRTDLSTSPRRDRSSRKRRDSSSDHEGRSRRRSRESRRRSRSPDSRNKRRRKSQSPRGDKDRSHRSSGRDSILYKDVEESTTANKCHRHYRDRSRRGHDEPSGSAARQTRSGRDEKRREHNTDETSDSDPLEDIVGPVPPTPVRVRGRGFQARSSGIDKRFDPDYDPKTDVDFEDIADNLDDAFERFRDRKKYEQAQEQRLREAGFQDDDIKKWKKGGQPSEDDVRWTKAGEQREWDRGKADDEPRKGLFSFSG